MKMEMSEWDKLWEEKVLHLKQGVSTVEIFNEFGHKWVKGTTRFNKLLSEEWLIRLKTIGDTMQAELDDSNSRMDWLLDSMPVSYDDLFEGYEPDE